MLRGLLVLFALAACGVGVAARAEVRQFTDALAADDLGLAVAAVPPDWRVVTLPDDWAVSRPRQSGPVAYRLRFTVTHLPERNALLGLAIERACGNLAVALNGQPLHAAGRRTDGFSADCERPLLLGLPTSLLVAGPNVIDLHLMGFPLEEVASHQRAGGLSAPQVGAYATLAARHERLMLLRVTAPQVAAFTLLLMGAVVLVMGWWHQRESHLAYFGALSIGWALLTARQWWYASDSPHYDNELLIVSTTPIVAFFAVQFLLHYARRRSRPIEVALVAQCVLVPVSLLLAGSQRVHMIASSWYALLALQVLAAMTYCLWLVRRERARDFWPLLALLGTGASMVVLEMVAQQRLVPAWMRVLPNIGMPLAFIGLGLRLVHQYGRALKSAEELRQSLEARIRDATAAMERSYAQMAELRVEQVTQQERKRIAADLHDDLGAKLLTIVHTSESERISNLAREALEEMRLSVRGLTGKPVRLIDALGDWRAEVVSRLSQTGIEGDWQAPGEELPQTLPARAYVQTTRILREAVNNIIKHSGASRCSIRCSIDQGDFKLAIQDNGKGIPLELDGRLDRGHGMSSMKHRAKQLQGQCLVESGPGYGTVIRLTIPLERHTEAP
ncbi:MAG TPA: ATP-binding protein [Burkholderiaceae bacterium]|nr:ATP-binding protein [Burkholderiaceae bacterium]